MGKRLRTIARFEHTFAGKQAKQLWARRARVQFQIDGRAALASARDAFDDFPCSGPSLSPCCLHTAEQPPDGPTKDAPP